MSENIDIVELTDNLSGETYDWVVIKKNDDEFIGMLKSTWDELEAAKEAQSL